MSFAIWPNFSSVIIEGLANFLGGLGEAVAGVLSEVPGVTVKRLAVRNLPRSGPPDALVEKFGISSTHIAAAVKEILISWSEIWKWAGSME